jgi:hypothetical protein
VCFIDEPFETIREMVTGRHFLDIDRHAYKLQSLLNLVLEEQGNRRRILPSIAHKESKG